jgi:hypothetical protein
MLASSQPARLLSKDLQPYQFKQYRIFEFPRYRTSPNRFNTILYWRASASSAASSSRPTSTSHIL